MIKPTNVTPLWNSQKKGFQESLSYLKGRKDGLIRSIVTPWPKVNDAMVDGIEWNTMTVIAGRPGSGKTLMKDQLITEAFVINNDQTFRVLEFSFEMVARTSAIREYSAHLGKTYKYLCSADGKLSTEDLQKCYEYAKKRVKFPIDIIETPLTVVEIKQQVEAYMQKHKVNNEYTKTIVTLDHTILVRKAKSESNNDMLFNLGEAITELKRKYPISFIILSQLNRNINKPERSENGSIGNYVLESDIFGADAMLQHGDTIIGLNRPGLLKISVYGPDKYIINSDKILVMHFLKCRNGDVRMSFFNAAFEKMQIEEAPTPGTT